MIRELTCIVCPRGCQLKVELDEKGAVLNVEGFTCPRGKQYAVDECTHPMRTITSTVRAANGEPLDRVGDLIRSRQRGIDFLVRKPRLIDYHERALRVVEPKRILQNDHSRQVNISFRACK